MSASDGVWPSTKFKVQLRNSATLVVRFVTDRENNSLECSVYIFYILRILWNRVPIFAMFVWNRVANSSFFLWNRSRVSRTQRHTPVLNYPTPPGSPPTFRYKKHKFYNLLKLHRMIHGSSGTWPAVVPQLIETGGRETPSRLHLFLRASLRHRLTFLELSTVLFTVPLTRMTELLRRQIFFCFYHMPFLVFLFSELTKINAY